MKIVVIGGTGLIGSKTVVILRQRGHVVVAASPQSGVNTITGEGLKGALAGAQVVIDLANRPPLKTKRCWSSSRLPSATFSRRRPQRAPASRRALDRRNRPERQWLFPRQGRPRETDRGFRRPLHHHPLDPIPGISRRHRRFKCGWKRTQDCARPVPAYRGGRRCSFRRRGGARSAATQHHRDRRP